MVNRHLVTAFVAAALAWPTIARAQDDLGIPVGNTPPAVTLEDLNGAPVDLAKYVGKQVVVLEFWAQWCPLCQALIPRMEAARVKYGANVQFIAVAVGVNQTPASIKRHLTQHPIPFTVLWDGKGAAVRAFDAPGTSYVVVLDAHGKVTYTGQGDEQNIDAAVASGLTPPTKPAGH